MSRRRKYDAAAPDEQRVVVRDDDGDSDDFDGLGAGEGSQDELLSPTGGGSGRGGHEEKTT